jgi:inner membrane protein
MARAGFNRKTALATMTMVLAAEAPDLDVVSDFGGRITGFEHHRGITHTLVGAPFVAACVVLMVWLWYRWRRRRKPIAGSPPRWGLLFLFAWLAVLSHLLLDFTNNYGVRPFEPFSYRWYSWDIVFIVEPVMWAILVAGLILPMLFALVDSEVGARSKTPRGLVGAIVALCLVVAFWGFRDFEHRRAVAAMKALTYYGQDANRVSAYPYPMNPFKWYGVVETNNFYQTMLVDSRVPEVDPDDRAVIYHKPEETPITLVAKNSAIGRIFLSWAQYPLPSVEKLEPPESGYMVRFVDLRFMYPGQTRRFGGAWVQLGPDLKVVSQNFGMHAAEYVRQTSQRGSFASPTVVQGGAAPPR